MVKRINKTLEKKMPLTKAISLKIHNKRIKERIIFLKIM